MIESIRHKGLRRLFEEDDSAKVNPEYAARLRLILSALDAVENIEEMDQPTFHLHALKGRLKGFWAVRVRADWRVIFRFADGRASDLDLIDYH
jgi:proteic killer suppression protein